MYGDDFVFFYVDRALVRDNSKKHFLASEWALWHNDLMTIRPFLVQ